MDREKAINELKKLNELCDEERAHATADDIVYEFLRDNGFSDVAEAYKKVGKWYA